MTEREARRLMDTIESSPCNLRPDWIGPAPGGVKWELIVTDTRSARQFLVGSPSQVSEYLHVSPPPRQRATTSTKQGLLF